MTFQLNLPPSYLSKLDKASANDEEAEDDKGNKRENYRQMKELEEMRKAGTAPAMQDEEGKDINPHIPQYIMQAPWYYQKTAPTLNHQRVHETHEKMKSYARVGEWYEKGIKEGKVATKYRKGACENCGAMTHKKKDCLERPRRVGARFTHQDIAPDEHLPENVLVDFEGKRDRWNGYDVDEHKRIYYEFAKLEEAKKQLKAKKLEDSLDEPGENKTKDSDADSDAGDDEDKYVDEMDMPGQKIDTATRITVRNLRIREDTAKYLYNLDVNSAHYDPKTRSMRENPFKNTGIDPEKLKYAGDNFVRLSGAANSFAQQQVFAWEAYEKGTDAHQQADPTKLALLQKEFNRRKDGHKEQVKQSIIEKYGGQEYLEAPPKNMLMAAGEDYVEYSRTGNIIKGPEKLEKKSRYEEDVYLNNHTSIWGSYWISGKWGFACCHQTVKQSYCTGAAGKEAASEAPPLAIEAQPQKGPQAEPPSSPEEEERGQENDLEEVDERSVTERTAKKKKKKKKRRKAAKRKRKESSSSSSSDSESDDEEKKKRKINKAIAKERARVAEVDKLLAKDERKRPYNSMYDVKEPTAEEIEAYHQTKRDPHDPMANFK